MLWQGAKWRILKNFKLQNEECHNYVGDLLQAISFWHVNMVDLPHVVNYGNT